MTRARKQTSGRSGTGNYTYRQNRAIVLATSTTCGICGHDGSETADHIIDDQHWPRDMYGRRLPGFDDVTNLQPAHGTMGRGKIRHNFCPVCGRLCNQSKGARVNARPQTRDWFPDR